MPDSKCVLVETLVDSIDFVMARSGVMEVHGSIAREGSIGFETAVDMRHTQAVEEEVWEASQIETAHSIVARTRQ